MYSEPYRYINVRTRRWRIAIRARVIPLVYPHGLLAIIPLVLLLGCNRALVPDAKLRDVYLANRDDFNKLVLMSKQDRPLVRITDDLSLMQTDSGVKKNVGLPEDRWQEYRVLFKKLGLEEGLERTDAIPSALLLYAHCEGSAIDADCKGFAYSEISLSPLATSLDELRPGYVFKQLCPNWYLVRWGD